MIFERERERERPRERDRDPIAFGKKTGNNRNENDQILYNAFYSSSQGKKNKKW